MLALLQCLVSLSLRAHRTLVVLVTLPYRHPPSLMIEWSSSHCYCSLEVVANELGVVGTLIGFAIVPILKDRSQAGIVEPMKQ